VHSAKCLGRRGEGSAKYIVHSAKCIVLGKKKKRGREKRVGGEDYIKM